MVDRLRLEQPQLRRAPRYGLGAPHLLVSALMLPLLFAGGCGGKVCEDAYDKMNQCVAALDCSKLGPLDRPACENTRRTWGQVDRTAYMLACDQDSSEAQKIVDCSLDPRTCTCSK